MVLSDTKVDFISGRRICAALSAALIISGGVAIFVRGGVPMGVDFRGGTEVQLAFGEGVEVHEMQIRAAFAAAGVENATVVRLGDQGGRDFVVRFLSDLDSISAEGFDGSTSMNAHVSAVEDNIRGGIGEFRLQRIEFIGPRVGAGLREDGASMALFLAIAALIYIAFHLGRRFVPGVVVVVAHDLMITGSILVILGIEFDLRILAAMLVVFGYSLNDTIILYDRIRENMELRTNARLRDVLNASVNQMLPRTLFTSITTPLTILSLYLLVGAVILPFVSAVLIGVVVRNYSSVFIASPVLLFSEEHVFSQQDSDSRAPSRP